MAILGAGTSIGGLSGSGAVSRLLVVISGNSSGLTSAIASANRSLAGFNKSARAIGSAMTRSVTLPLLALGGVSLKLASDYASAIGRVQGLTSVLDDGQHSIEAVSESLLQLSQIVPTSPVDLANSLYYAGSAGLEFSQAMDVVTLSAKAAAIGMGEAKDVSKVLIFALNAFRGTGLTAAHAMDVLTAAIKYGTAEPEEMAIALGRLLPIARDAGIAFDTVAASVAALTNIGLPTRVATTSLRALFTELLAPTIQATDKLNQLGISAKQLRDALTLGPVAAFKLLTEATGGSQDALHDIIPQIRGFTAFTGLSGDALKRYKETIDNVTHSSGALNKAFSIISKTPAFQFEIALNKLRVAGIKMGNVLVPVFLKVMDVVGDVADAISGMPPIFQTLAVAVGLVAASMGPLIRLWSAMVAEGGGLFSTFKSSAVGLTVMATAAVAAVAGFSSLARGSTSVFSAMTTLAGTFVAVGLALKGLQSIAASSAITGALSSMASVAPKAAFGLMSLATSLSSMSTGAIVVAAAAIAGLAVLIGNIIGHTHQFENTVTQAGDALTNAAIGAETMATALESIENAEVADTLRELAKSLHLLNKPVGQALPQSIELARNRVKELHHEFSTAVDRSGVFIEHMDNIDAALRQIEDGPTTAAAAFKSFGMDVQDFTDGLVSQFAFAGTSTEGLDTKFKALFEVIDSGVAVNEKYRRKVLDQLAAVHLNDQAVQSLAKHFGVSTDVINNSLSGLGTTALDVTSLGAKGFRSFGFAAFGGFGKAAARAQVAQAAIEELANSLSESLGGNLGLFDEFDKKIKKSTDSIVAHAQKAASLALTQAENVQTLLARGVPAGLVQELVEQGPQMIQKFVDASGGQLDKLVNAYEIRLGAIDAAILKEGIHQEGKGRNMVQGFVTAILSSQGITQNAGHKIVNAVAQGLQQGNLKPAALNKLLQFVRTIEASGLPKQAASKVITSFVQGIASKKGAAVAPALAVVQRLSAAMKSSGLPRAAAASVIQAVVQKLSQSQGALPQGAKATQRFAQGIVSRAGVARADAGIVVAGVTEALRSASDGAYGSGAAVGSAFAAGIRASAAGAILAARQMANEARAALNSASYGSPKRFSWYIARDIGEQYAEGMKEQGFDFRRGQHSVEVHHRRASGNKQQRLVFLDGSITINGMDGRIRGLAREEAVAELAYRGV